MNFKVGNYYLDEEQSKIVIDNSKHLLVVAGAGSGKTLTILGKIKYLIEKKGVPKNEIICISFTDAASKDFKRKIAEELNTDLNVHTFHKLSLEILKRKIQFDIADPNLLEDITREYFKEDILKNKEALKLLLRYFNLKNKEEYLKFYNNNYFEILSLEHLLSTFIHLFKSNNFQLKDFLKFLDKAKMTFNIKRYAREKIILTLAISVYNKYTTYLKDSEEIDFDDMLIEAKNSVDNFGFFHRVKYIIIDEYQDTSPVRFDLIKSILDKTNSSLVVVGDDFQSIYRFTGCDLSLFLNFKKIFPKGKILKIQNTYRNSQELIKIAGDFVMKNKKQIKKKLKSGKSLKKPIVINYSINLKTSFLSLIKKIHQENDGDILVLGRNNRDYLPYLDTSLFEYKEGSIIYKENLSIKIKYLTVHKSKGLESDNVIILNLRDDILGFPNQMKDDKILRFVSSETTHYPFDEERRLFYVALTRTKNKVYLLVPKIKESVFITELIDNYYNQIEIIK